MKLLSCLLTIAFLSTATSFAASPKVLMLIIASDNRDYWIEDQKIWRSYMRLAPDSVEAYLIKADPKLKKLYQIDDDHVWSKTEESIIPGVMNKTLLSLEALLPRLHEFDFLVRTNISSFYVFPRLVEFLKTLPRENCYCGVAGKFDQIDYVSGAGIILSTDLARLLVVNKKELWNNQLHDDVLIGKFMQQQGVEIIPAQRKDLLSLEDWQASKEQIAPDIFHFRVRNNIEEKRMSDEIYILRELAEMFYSVEMAF